MCIAVMEQQLQSKSQLRRILLTVRPETTFPVPLSDGYSVYSALLGVLDEINTEVSAQIHDSPLGSLHTSGLQGVFANSDRCHHKTLRRDKTYQLTLGIVDPADTEIFQALVNGLVLEGDSFELSHGTLRVESFESENTTHEELLNRANGMADPTIGIQFRTCTCIEEADEVTTMFPHRVPVFRSLLEKWNRSCPNSLALDLSEDKIAESVFEKPDAGTYDTHSVLINRVKNEDGETRNIFRQGFTGECAYAFKDASESVENAVTAVALFGEYSGVGSAVSRGCGSTEVEIE